MQLPTGKKEGSSVTKIDLCLLNANVLNVFNRTFEKKNVGITDGVIMVVEKPDQHIEADQYQNLAGKYLVPGFIDAHMHVESAMVAPSELGKVLLKNGETSIVADPHEIANVCGVSGIDYMLRDAKQTPLDIFYMLPSSVPCTPISHNGASLPAATLKPLYQREGVHGLAEVMDYPAVASQQTDVMQKIHDAQEAGYHADGHGAGLNYDQLQVFKRAGISDDHECTTLQEAEDRLNAGLNVFLREGSVERDLENTIGVVTEANAQRFAFCTDDKTISDIINEGGIDRCVRLAMKAGINPATAYTMASYNAAQAQQLTNKGAIVAGSDADLVVVSDMAAVTVEKTMKAGHWVTESDSNTTPFNKQTVHHHLNRKDLVLSLDSSTCNVIGVKPNHIETAHLQCEVPLENGEFTSDTTQDILKIVVVERHHNLGTSSVGLVKGFGIKNGAVATTVAHDDHNIVAVGTDDASIFAAITRITETNGGIAVAQDGTVIGEMPLAIAGLMSDKPYQEASADLDGLFKAYKVITGQKTVAFDPFITLSFLTLPVIPTIKMTDQGLYDFEKGDFIDVACQTPVLNGVK
ncbi:adenine deaminase [Secundilactobacillus collinoides DSM 20515 = JCM 1123]|uniref:Adenine deaminase n=1 Tax=Secundilactobacillus collinoides DSM 20515 = JCM 1123 TaxID=1423733 RepID=A0A0R2BFS4_SECCO|nr:adenine deaminase [Secundilactobacillus collinoides DSM 20515 = JCM 1123]